MKKIAFMFAAAAMFVACNKAQEVTLTKADSSDVMNQVATEWEQKAGEASAMVDETTLDYSAAVTPEDTAAVKEAAHKAAYDAIASVIRDTTNAEFNAAYKAALAKCLEAKKAPKQGEQKEGEQK